MSDILDFFEEPPKEKKRHGCVTAWLIFMIVVNGIVAIIYVMQSDDIKESFGGQVSTITIGTFILLSLLNVFCASLLLRWKKIGFYGFALTAVAGIVINIMIGIGGSSVTGLVGVGLLYGILQIKNQNGHSAWSLLE